MAKKGKNRRKNKKNKKIKQNYNKKEFCEVFCQTCLICKNPDPKFCYVYLYKNEAKSFCNKVFNNLIDIHVAYQSMGRAVLSMSVEQFQNVVCRTGICFNGDIYASASCDGVKSCYASFKHQMGVANSAIIHEANADNLIEFKNNKTNKNIISYKKRQRKKARKARRTVFVAYPTFFTRDNAEFQAAIRKILYGDNDNQQDKDQELSTADTRAASGDTEG